MRQLQTLLLLLFLPAALTAQQPAALLPLPQDAIKDALQQVSRQHLEAIVRKLVSFGTRNTFSETSSKTHGIGAARRWIKQHFEELSKATGGNLQVALETSPVIPGRGRRPVPPGTTVTNVVATLPGRDKNRYLIVSGHYDSRASRGRDGKSDAPGADDDASGVAVAMEAARVMGGLHPRATVLFVAFDGEEHGLWGSRALARSARKAGWQVSAMMTNDIVGGALGSDGKREPMRLRLFSEGVPSGPVDSSGRPARRVVGSQNDAPSRQLARYLRRRAQLYLPAFEVTLIFRQDRYLRGGDHYSFNREGFAAVRWTEPHENFDWQHQDVRVVAGRQFGDVVEHVDFDYLRRVAQANVAGLMELALAPPAPKHVRMLVARLSPDTELRWEAPPVTDLRGFGILYRRTHEPFWTKRVEVPAGHQSVVLTGLSKDDYLFAVQAIDKAGHRSLPVYPRPARR